MSSSFFSSAAGPGSRHATTPSNPSDGVGPVLDALESAGPQGAGVAKLATMTNYSEAYLQEVLRLLQSSEMVACEANNYTLTSFGVKAKYLVTR